ncbi:MAG: c-type cytochrome [Pseudomonadota bacterium]
MTHRIAIQGLAAAFLAIFANGCGDASEKTSATEPPEPESLETIGRRAFAACAICHSVRPASEGLQAGKIGPTLSGIVGRYSASIDAFAYSRAFQKTSFIWDEARLDAFIASPGAVVRGNRMSYPGEPDPEKRAAIIAYLKTLQ